MIYLIVLLPLLGSIISGFWGRKIGDKISMYLTSSFLVFSMVLGWIKFFQISQNHIDIILPLFSWIEIGELSVSWSIRYDMLTAVMIIVITTVSAMVHI